MISFILSQRHGIKSFFKQFTLFVFLCLSPTTYKRKVLIKVRKAHTHTRKRETHTQQDTNSEGCSEELREHLGRSYPSLQQSLVSEEVFFPYLKLVILNKRYGCWWVHVLGINNSWFGLEFIRLVQQGKGRLYWPEKKFIRLLGQLKESEEEGRHLGILPHFLLY